MERGEHGARGPGRSPRSSRAPEWLAEPSANPHLLPPPLASILRAPRHPRPADRPAAARAPSPRFFSFLSRSLASRAATNAIEFVSRASRSMRFWRRLDAEACPPPRAGVTKQAERPPWLRRPRSSGEPDATARGAHASLCPIRFVCNSIENEMR